MYAVRTWYIIHLFFLLRDYLLKLTMYLVAIRAVTTICHLTTLGNHEGSHVMHLQQRGSS